jgi:hypothetical protein
MTDAADEIERLRALLDDANERLRKLNRRCVAHGDALGADSP